MNSTYLDLGFVVHIDSYPSGVHKYAVRVTASENRLTSITRTQIADYLRIKQISWAGRQEEQDFLARCYQLEDLPSYDHRFHNAAGDIWQHRTNNPHDWDDYWVFGDERFELINGDDSVFLRFLAETLHPALMRSEEEVLSLLAFYNEKINRDGYELFQIDSISTLPIFGFRELGKSFHGDRPEIDLSAISPENRAVIHEHLERIKQNLNIDQSSAISTCKNLLESLLKIILDENQISYNGKRDDLPKLYHQVSLFLETSPSQFPLENEVDTTNKKILGSLANIVQSIAEVRNLVGTGHGRTEAVSLNSAQTRLILNSTVSIIEFILETYEMRN